MTSLRARALRRVMLPCLVGVAWATLPWVVRAQDADAGTPPSVEDAGAPEPPPDAGPPEPPPQAPEPPPQAPEPPPQAPEPPPQAPETDASDSPPPPDPPEPASEADPPEAPPTPDPEPPEPVEEPEASIDMSMFDEAEELGVTAVVPTRTPPPVAATSTLSIEPGLLRDVPRRSADELLTLAPGVLTANHAGEGHAPTLYLRGFDAGEGQDVELRVDGIPINEPSNAHGHGYADPRFVIPELVSGLNVAQGPFDPRQGDFAIAGTVDYRLGLARRGILLRGEYGSFDTRRLVLAWAPEDAEPGTFVGVELRDGQGFGPNRAHFGAAALGRLELEVERGLRVSLLGAAQSAQFDSAGVVRRDDIERGTFACGDVDPTFCVADPNQGGSASRYLLALGVDWSRPNERFTTRAWGGFRQLRVRENFTGQLLDPRGDGLDERYEVGTLGLQGAYRVRVPWDGRDHHVELGWFGRHDTGETVMQRIRRERGVPYASVFDAALHVTDIGGWLMGDVSPAEWLLVQAGLRVDAFQYSVTDRGLPVSDREGPRLPEASTDAFGIAFQPRGSVIVRLHESLTWTTSAGVGTRSSDAVALSEGESAPFARAVALESGLGLALAEARRYDVTARLGVFHTYVDRELVFDPNRGRNVAAGSSNRYGAFAYARVRFEEWLDAGASVAWTEANLAADAGWFDLTAGARLPYVPRVMGRVDLAARKGFRLEGEPFEVGAAAGVTWLGPRPLPNGAEGDGYAVIDASAHVGWRFVELGLLLRNLLDARYERASFSYVSSFDATRAPSMTPASHFAAGAPFSFFLTLTLHLTPVRWVRGDDEPEHER
ncbi:MAG: TonB-dependent receptor [Sandaracinaceae bacterium]|nr:TonB-dependent receptor [Sandaracinaceae bacterium]